MNVILLENIEKLGFKDEIVNVKNGYGRNFLIPTGKAVRADEENKAEYEKRKEEILKAEIDRKQAANEQAMKLESLVLNIEVPVSEEGTLYGSVGTREITDAIAEKGIDLEKSSIRLPEGTFKEVGEYSLDIELHPEVVQSIKVVIAAKEEN